MEMQILNINIKYSNLSIVTEKGLLFVNGQ